MGRVTKIDGPERRSARGHSIESRGDGAAQFICDKQTELHQPDIE